MDVETEMQKSSIKQHFLKFINKVFTNLNQVFSVNTSLQSVGYV